MRDSSDDPNGPRACSAAAGASPPVSTRHGSSDTPLATTPDSHAEHGSTGRLAYLRQRGEALRREVEEGVPPLAGLTDDEILAVFPGSTIDHLEESPNATESYEGLEAGRVLSEGRNGQERLATDAEEALLGRVLRLIGGDG
jgi:hypothetical protein